MKCLVLAISITSSYLENSGGNCYELSVPNNTVQCINNKNFKSDDDTSGGGPCILVERICTLKDGYCEYLTLEKSNQYDCSLNEFNTDCVGKLKYCNQVQGLGEKSCYDFPVRTEGYVCANNIDSNDKILIRMINLVKKWNYVKKSNFFLVFRV